MGLTAKSSVQELFDTWVEEVKECLDDASSALQDTPGASLDSLNYAEGLLKQLDEIVVNISFGGEYNG